MAIKIDVEGHEIQALDGVVDVLSQNACYLQVEALDADSKAAVDDFMAQLGYRRLFVMRDDMMYVSRELLQESDGIREIIFERLGRELADLLLLRREKRRNANAARALWEQSRYKQDPLSLSASGS